MLRNNDCTTGTSLDFLYHQNYSNLIGIDLSKQTNTCIPQQIKFTWKLEKAANNHSELFFSFINCNID